MRLINADKVIADLQAMQTQFDAIAIDGMIRGIERQPTIEAEPVRHGEWFDKGSLSCRCSECGCKHTKESAYCPHCGAKMDAKEA